MRQAARRSVYPSRYCLDGFGFARRFSRELIGVTDGVVFDLTRLFDYAVTFLLCVLLHRIGTGFRLLGDGVRLLVRISRR